MNAPSAEAMAFAAKWCRDVARRAQMAHAIDAFANAAVVQRQALDAQRREQLRWARRGEAKK